ncbi:MAG TPA: hypothetical protein VFK87_01790, partial [Steroidobacteraceae bacterium]|nr:hypothetical protein [Steroidobacteraceae bacterium]
GERGEESGGERIAGAIAREGEGAASERRAEACGDGADQNPRDEPDKTDDTPPCQAVARPQQRSRT